MSKKLLFALISVLMIGSMLLAACQPAATEAPAAEEPAAEEPAATEESVATEEPVAEEPAEVRDTLVFATTDSYSSQDPFTNAWHSYQSYAMFETLIGLKPDLSEYVPIMVTGWEISEDNKTITFHLREDVVFHDGTPFNAQALEWNINMYMDETLASPQGGDMRDNLESFEVIDDYTVAFHLLNPYAPFFNYISGLEIVSPTAYEEYGPDEFPMHLVGAGMWKVTEVVPDNYIAYEANPDYAWGPSYYTNSGPIAIPKYQIRFMSDPEVIYASLETGEVTIAFIPPAYLEQAQANENISIVEGLETTLHYLGINNEDPLLSDLAVRTAIFKAVNREEILEVAYEGLGIATYGPLTPAEIGYSQEVEDYAASMANDIEGAKAVLEEAGYTLNANGVYEKDGVALEFSLMTEPAAVNLRACEVLQAQLADVGIAVTIEQAESTVIKEATVNGTHQLIYWIYGLLDPSIMTYIFHSSRIGASNRNRVTDLELDALIEDMDRTLDPAERNEKVELVSRRVIDMHYHIPLFTLKSYLGYRNDQIEGLVFDKLGGFGLLDASLIQ